MFPFLGLLFCVGFGATQTASQQHRSAPAVMLPHGASAESGSLAFPLKRYTNLITYFIGRF
ncbi:MAG: hypothetical protein CMM73_05600 [Rhodospirillaceae bacterium]|nr:hypothetical protein [Rhodospirillaceae bacterium]